MIDITNENLIRICDVPRRLPARPSGRRIHVSTVYRWIMRGVRGVCLEVIRVGGTTYTSAEALQRFADHLSAPPAPGPIPVTWMTMARRKQIEEAEKRVDAILYPHRKTRKSDTTKTD